MPSNHPILCYLLLFLPSIFPSIRVFSNKSALHIRWPKYWSFRFIISPPRTIQNWFPLELISLLSEGLSRDFSSTTIQKHQLFGTQPSLWFKGCQSYDKPRQHIKKQRQYFTNKGPSSQSFGFSSSHVRMWELDHEEGRGWKNLYFWTVVLEKTLQSLLDCKEI